LLALPFRGLFGIFRKISEMADRELSDEAYIQEKLLELQLLYEMDEIDGEEYEHQAAVWEARLNAAMGGEAGEELGEKARVRESRAA
jgi:hypothetical protein